MEITQSSFRAVTPPSNLLLSAIATDSLECPVKPSPHLAWPHFEVDVVSAAKSTCWENVEKYVACHALLQSFV